MKAKILYRGREFQEFEAPDASDFFQDIIDSRMDIAKDDLVIGRYSVLPFYTELERDCKKVGAKLINSYNEHLYAADMQNWYEDLYEHTPKTWFRVEQVPAGEGPFVVKGETNSRKFQWDTHMFAPTKADVIRIAGLLMNDGLLCDQKVCVRKYEPLVTYMHSLQGLPITQEFRLFVYKGVVLSVGYYWSSHLLDLQELGLNKPIECDPPMDWMNSVLKTVADKIPFVVIDIAKTAAGKWIVVELNDGQMSGLSCNKPQTLYRYLAGRLHAEGHSGVSI